MNSPSPYGRVLDIGCGAGLFVDYRYRNIDRENYVGIDPSFGMLGKFRLKHPDYDAHATLLRTTFEDYETTPRFDTIVAMSGAASYVTGADVVAKTRRLLAPGGRAILTFYRDPAGFYERSVSERHPNWPRFPPPPRNTATFASWNSPSTTTDVRFPPSESSTALHARERGASCPHAATRRSELRDRPGTGAACETGVRVDSRRRQCEDSGCRRQAPDPDVLEDVAGGSGAPRRRRRGHRRGRQYSAVERPMRARRRRCVRAAQAR